MPIAQSSFTHSHRVLDDGSVVFKCASAPTDWPWLALPAFHPAVVQAINYYASVEASLARGAYDPDKWTALTQTSWTCGEPGVGHATHGVSETRIDEKSISYALTFFGEQGQFVYRMTGKGVVFRTRDFETWREKKKEIERGAAQIDDFEYASAALLGVESQIERFISPLATGAQLLATGLITEENGLSPSHPYIDGSGDHVNSTHLVEAGRQIVSLVRDGRGFTVLGGEMKFSRYVELGVPFRIALSGEVTEKDEYALTVHQLDKVCASMNFRCQDR